MESILAVLSAFLVSVLLMPLSIRLFKSINLLDKPNKRKIHSIDKPSLGGIPIFFGMVSSLLISNSIYALADQKFLLAAAFLVFLLGIRDDLASLQARHKLVVQIFAAYLVVAIGGVQIHGLHGLFGINEFSWYFNEIFTIAVIVIMTNAFNLIDGIDGLAGSAAIVISLFFGGAFLLAGAFVEAAIAFAIVGAACGFLVYNWYPSKVFMGDTGSMFLGFTLTVLTVRFLSTSSTIGWMESPVAICLALFVLPVYDTLRVFIIRARAKKNPLAPDRNHLHHVLLKMGYNHSKSTSILVLLHLSILGLILILQPLGNIWLTLLMFSLLAAVGAFFDRKLLKRESARTARLRAERFQVTKSA
ncbi:MAG: MraY family glycosyltransferase [Bacteroidota bacterium]